MDLLLHTMNLIGKLQNNYEHLWKQIVRPARNNYSEDSLGPARFTLEGVDIQRRDFSLTSMRDFKFEGSIWIPSSAEGSGYSCVVYCHSNNGNRTEW